MSDCNCFHWDNVPAVRLCEPHHKYHIGGKQLASVSSVLRSTLPITPGYAAASPDVVENARLRGVSCDTLFSAYVNGTLDEIPQGTRLDVWDPLSKDGLLQRLIPWWDRLGIRNAQAQVTLNDDEIAGTADVVTPDCIFDLKTVHTLQPSYELQLGGYLDLDAVNGDIKKAAIIHVTRRFHEPKLVWLDEHRCHADWFTVREMWRLIRRMK